jgi:hypothetical protein
MINIFVLFKKEFYTLSFFMHPYNNDFKIGKNILLILKSEKITGIILILKLENFILLILKSEK